MFSRELNEAIQGNDFQEVRNLLDLFRREWKDFDINAPDDAKHHPRTPLTYAIESPNVSCDIVKYLIACGSSVNQAALSAATDTSASPAKLRAVIEAGADPRHLDYDAVRLLIGFVTTPDRSLLNATQKDFERGRHIRFGRNNPEKMHEPFWQAMIHAGVTAAAARDIYLQRDFNKPPVWCFARSGQSVTVTPDGRVILVGGEHEDFYDPDFCIYNDVTVVETDGSFSVYGYPADDFPPTDFHSATLIGDDIYLIGSLGYRTARQSNETPVYRLNIETLQIESVKTAGDKPGWIHGHRARARNDHEIEVSEGKIHTLVDDEPVISANPHTYILDTLERRWHRAVKTQTAPNAHV